MSEALQILGKEMIIGVREAGSAYKAKQVLSVEGYDAMKWSKKQSGRWALKQTGISSNPGVVRITGQEGTIEVNVTER